MSNFQSTLTTIISILDKGDASWNDGDRNAARRLSTKLQDNYMPGAKSRASAPKVPAAPKSVAVSAVASIPSQSPDISAIVAAVLAAMQQSASSAPVKPPHNGNGNGKFAQNAQQLRK